MDDSSDVDMSPKKIKKSRWGPVTENDSPMKNAKEAKRKALPNGTGNSSDHSSENDANPKPQKTIKITKISKTVKTEESKAKDNSSSKEECSSVKSSRKTSCDSPTGSPSSDSDFHGFDLEEDSSQSGKKSKINKLLDQLNASTSNADENVPKETEKEVNIEEDKEDEVVPEGEEEEMTVDAGQPETATDSDSDQMEIDMGTESEKAVERTKDKESDVDVMDTDSVTSGVDKSSVKEEGSVTESNGQAAEAPILESSLKGSANTGGKSQPRVEYCGVCSAEVDDEEAGICCDGACERWFHLRCSGLTQEEYDELSLDENAKWACSKCSGRPPPVLNPEAKPLLTVRKDLAKVVTPLPKRKSMKGGPRTPKIDISNPAFLKPFDFGWKRELVYRSTNDDQNRRQGDIYYYTPKGKKLRSLREISEHLGGTDLTQDNFTFWKEPLGIDDPDKEIIRDAKFKSTTKDSTASPSTPRTLKTPKPPKATKVTPKLTATVTPLDTSGGAVSTPKVSASVTPRVVFKGKTHQNLAKFKVAPSKNTVPGQAQKIIISKGAESKPAKKLEDIIADPRIPKVVDDIETSNDTELKRRNKFRRYGLLANAKTRRVHRQNSTSSTSSSSSSDDSKDTRPLKPQNKELKALTQSYEKFKTSKSKTNSKPELPARNSSPEMDKTCKKSSETKVSPLVYVQEHNLSKDKKNIPSTPILPMIKPLVDKSPNDCLLPITDRQRPSPPEIQFRPSNPSSYGCQTSSSTPRHSFGSLVGPSSSVFRSSPQFETVLIVDTASSHEGFVNSPKRKNSPLILNEGDCPFKIISVESFPTGKNGIKEGGSVSQLMNHSPVSIGSSSTEEVLVIDEDCEDSSPPCLIRNSPPPNLTKNTSSPNRSPPSLQPVSQDWRKLNTSTSPFEIIARTFNQPNTANSKLEVAQFNTGKKKGLSDEDELEMGMLPPMWEEPMPSKPKEKVTQPQDVCSIGCLPAMGLIPTLQCHVCLCLYHPECVGLEEANHRPIHSYKCKNCQLEKPKPQPNGPKTILAPPPLTPISSLSCTSSTNSLTPLIPAPPKLQRITAGKPVVPRTRVPLTKTSSIVGGVTTWLPPSSTIQMRPPPPAAKQRPQPPTSSAVIDPASTQPVQTLVSMDCKRYIVVPKHNVLSVSPATTTSSVQVADPSNVQITTAASDPSTTTSTLASSYPNANIPILPKPPQVTSSAAFIVGSPTVTNSFQNPPGVLLVPYLGPQMSPTPKDGQQPQYIVVNGPSGLPSGNFIIGNIPQQQPLKLPTVPTSQPAEPPPESPGGAKRPLESGTESPVAKRAKIDAVPQNFMQNVNYAYGALLHAFQYLKVQELLRCSRVCHMWRDVALHKCLWETVRMKNSQVKDWEGFSATMRRVGARHLDLRKILMPDKQESLRAMWTDCVKALGKVNTLVKLDLCRCASTLLEQIAAVCPQLEVIAAGTIKSNQLNMTNLGNCQNLQELKLKSVNGMTISNVAVLANLTKLKQLSLTTVKNMDNVLEVVGKMGQLESLELGEILNVTETVVSESFSQLTKLRRLRLEKGQNDCPTDTIFQTISKLPSLVQLELINFDVKAGFEESLALCTNIKILLIIPTYVTQSATTNHLVIEGVSKLSKSLNHFVWGLTLELLRVTDLFIDQWEMGQKNSGPKSPTQESQQKKSKGDSIPILKPTNKDGKKSKESAVTQVDVLQLPKLHKVLTTLLPTTKIIILKVPFSATWRQTISNSAQ